MAASWIKMRVDLRDDPAVVSIARKLNLDVDAVVGKLHAVWSWADRVTEDGMVDGVDARLVDDVARRKGFAAAMAATPRSAWLVLREQAVEFPRFDRHNGRSAKRRALDTERKRDERGTADPSPHDAPNPSAAHADNPPTESGPEKRREEKKRKDVPPTAGGDADAPRSPVASKPARKEPTGPHAEAVAWWCAEFERTRGSPYAFGGKKDGERVRVLLASSSLAEFKSRATALLDSQDAFYAHADLGILQAHYNKFAARRPPPRPGYDRPGEPEPTGPKVDPAVARRAIKDAIKATVEGFTEPSQATEGA